MKTNTHLPTGTPAFGGQTWNYQSFLVLPTPEEMAAAAGTAITSKKWAKGTLRLTDGPDASAKGNLTFQPGVELEVSVQTKPDLEEHRFVFEATGTGTTVPLAGCINRLAGWVFCDAQGRIESVRGSIHAVRGTDANPKIEPGGMPIGTVGMFLITPAE